MNVMVKRETGNIWRKKKLAKRTAAATASAKKQKMVNVFKVCYDCDIKII